MTLARLLSPSMLVIEDADLIARQREDMGGPCEEVLLNRLLNEMDGLKENTDILFVLTTNRPESMEAALRARPGRIDQAIEFPFPDADGRRKLARLYGRGARIPEMVFDHIVERTGGVSAAFLKELMRRSVQFALERAASPEIQTADIESALDELLFSGGRLNAALLGATGRDAQS
jgi:ATP-dependent 26S proteasome regulatory subunit